MSACLTADRVARLEALAVDVDPWIETEKGALITHPVLVEVRQQANLLARLVASLRLPDPKTGRRPQTRPLRGVHAPAPVSSLERARQRAEEHEPPVALPHAAPRIWPVATSRQRSPLHSDRKVLTT